MIRSLSRISNISENAFVSHRCLSTIQPAKHYDIIVAGGGMVGTTLACTLGKNPILSEKSIMLLESSPPKPWNLSQKYGNRVSALNKTSFDLLNKIGAWEHITQARFAPVKRMQVILDHVVFKYKIYIFRFGKACIILQLLLKVINVMSLLLTLWKMICCAMLC